MQEIGEKIREIRKKKGLSQEELAELAQVNLRTIQRIENNESEPRGITLKLICDVLDVRIEDILDYGKKIDQSYLTYFHLSVLASIVIPFGNFVLPYILWLNNKDRIIGLDKIGANLLNFQIVWSGLSYLLILIFAFTKINHWDYADMLFYAFVGLNLINMVLPILFAVRTKRGKPTNGYPSIIKLIK
ncbi:MAG: DNA-binding protein [Bacteroidetes bacterium]|nr:MAG: DNA-binding protein [Bacteroidota bacterium]